LEITGGNINSDDAVSIGGVDMLIDKSFENLDSCSAEMKTSQESKTLNTAL
jgi:hypothetical protein